MRGDALEDVLEAGYEVKPGASRAEVNAALVLVLARLETARTTAEHLVAAVLTMARPSRIITSEAAEALLYRVRVAEQGCRFTVERLEGLDVDKERRTITAIRGHDAADELASEAATLLEHLATHMDGLGPRVRASYHGLAQALGRFQKEETRCASGSS